MSTRARTPKAAPELGRVPYRFTADQVLRMVELGIFARADDVELWDGVLFAMVKGELHNYIVSQVADALRRSILEGFHVREEKSCTDGDRSLPEPDVAVCRGRKGDYLPDPPPLARLALVVEVDHHTSAADKVAKYRRYAAVGIPVYWRVDVEACRVDVHGEPLGGGPNARYGTSRGLAIGEVLAIEVDGREVGRVAVADLFPPEPAH